MGARLLAALWLAVFAALACSRAPERAVLVTIDTLRADRVGCYGDSVAATPVLDAVAGKGVRFAVAISPAPLTLPTHATLLTGLDPPRHGVHHNGTFRLEQDLPTLAERLRDQGLATAAFVSAYVLDRDFGLARGFDRYDDRMSAERPEGEASFVAERRADATVDAALAWLAAAPERFFLWVHLYDPHAPQRPPEPWASRFALDPYAGEVAFADEQLGRLLAALEERHDDGRTLLVVTSDHGESLGDHGEPTHAYGLYDATQRVPLLVRGPGVPRARVVETPVRLVDVAPTVLALLGAPPLEGADGRSLVPLWRGSAAAAPGVAYLETLATRFDMGWSPLFGVRSVRWKYIRAPRPELYDVAADPAERRNLAESEPERVAELDALLTERLAEAAPATPNRSVSAEERARLEALGYVLGRDAELALRLGEVDGPNPRDFLADLRARHDANRLIGAGRPLEALERLAGIESAGPDVERLRGLASLNAGDAAGAEAAFRRAIAQNPLRQENHHLLGLALARLERLDEAEASLRQAAEFAPATGALYTARGHLAEQRGERERAATYYAEAVDARVPDREALWRLAALRIEDGRRDEAERLLAGLHPDARRAPEAVVRLAEAEYHGGQPERALERLAGLEPRDDPALRSREATYLEAAGRLEEALAAREALLADAPEDPAAQNDVAWTLAALGRDLGRALALAEAGVSGSGRAPATLDTLAAVRLRRGEPLAALATIDRALAGARGPVRASLLVSRAEALARLGRRVEAKAVLAASLDGEGARAVTGLARRRARVEALLSDPEGE